MITVAAKVTEVICRSRADGDSYSAVLSIDEGSLTTIRLTPEAYVTLRDGVREGKAFTIAVSPKGDAS